MFTTPPPFPTPTFPSGFTCPVGHVCAYVTTVRGHHSTSTSPLTYAIEASAVAVLFIAVVFWAYRRASRH
jgi:hypothetical protein